VLQKECVGIALWMHEGRYCVWLRVAVSPKVTTTNGSDLNPSIAVISRALTRVIRRNFATLVGGGVASGLGTELDDDGELGEGDEA
jgi:hypothetical protein